MFCVWNSLKRMSRHHPRTPSEVMRMIANEIYSNRPSSLSPYETIPSVYLRRHVYLYCQSTASWSQKNAAKLAKECTTMVTSMLRYLCGDVDIDTLPASINTATATGNTQNARAEVMSRPPKYIFIYLHYCRTERMLYIWSHLLIHSCLESCVAA